MPLTPTRHFRLPEAVTNSRGPISTFYAANIIAPMDQNTKTLLVLTMFYAFVAALFGFGSDIFTFRSAYAGDGREILMLLVRLIVFIALAVILVFKGAGRESSRPSRWPR